MLLMLHNASSTYVCHSPSAFFFLTPRDENSSKSQLKFLKMNNFPPHLFNFFKLMKILFKKETTSINSVLLYFFPIKTVKETKRITKKQTKAFYD